MQESALSVRGKPIYGRHTVSAASRTSFPLPTVAFPPTWALTCPSQPAALRSEDRERQQLALVDGQKLSRIKIAEAVGGEIVLNVLLVLRRGGAHRGRTSQKRSILSNAPFFT